MKRSEIWILHCEGVENGRSIVSDYANPSKTYFHQLKIAATRPYLRVSLSVPLDNFIGYGRAARSCDSLRKAAAMEAACYVWNRSDLRYIVKEPYARAAVRYSSQYRKFLVELVFPVNYFELKKCTK